jgi:hypothetical protein
MSVLAGSSTMKLARSIQERTEAKHHLLMEKAHNYLQSYLLELLGPRVAFCHTRF